METTTDWAAIAAELERLLKLRATPFGMKLFRERAQMEAIPKIRRPKAIHTMDQIVAQAARLGWTVGVCADDLVGAQCRAVVGLGRAKDAQWQSGEQMVGVWYKTLEDATRHQQAMHCVPDGLYEALAVSPLASGRLGTPDIALFYATPGAMMYFINGLQWSGYQKFDWSVVGESSCADSWGRPQDRPAQPVDPLLCRAALRRRARRRNAHGPAAGIPAARHRGHARAGEKRPALPLPAVFDSAGCTRGTRRELPRRAGGLSMRLQMLFFE